MIDFDPQQRALFECIEETIPDLDEKLFEELDDNGIETVEQFEDAFAGSYDGYGSKSPEAQFTEELVSDCGYLENDLPSFISNHIDYQEIWDCELIHDYFTIEHNNQTYFFSRHF
jgi:hypothetical protein